MQGSGKNFSRRWEDFNPRDINKTNKTNMIFPFKPGQIKMFSFYGAEVEPQMFCKYKRGFFLGQLFKVSDRCWNKVILGLHLSRTHHYQLYNELHMNITVWLIIHSCKTHLHPLILQFYNNVIFWTLSSWNWNSFCTIYHSLRQIKNRNTYSLSFAK